MTGRSAPAVAAHRRALHVAFALGSALLVLALGPAPQACAQPARRPAQSTVAQREARRALAIEVAAARHLLARSTAHGFPLRSVSVDPALADPASAPGRPGPVRRDSARTAALAAALGARVAAGPASAGVHVVLSLPVARGDTARVSGTVGWPAAGRSGAGYETLALVLVWERGAWRVVRARRLGIS